MDKYSPICECQSRVFPTNRRIVSPKTHKKEKIHIKTQTYVDLSLLLPLSYPPPPTLQAPSLASQYTLLICFVFFRLFWSFQSITSFLNYLSVIKKNNIELKKVCILSNDWSIEVQRVRLSYWGGDWHFITTKV